MEAQAAAQFSVQSNNTWAMAAPFLTTPTTAKAFGTLYKNNTSNPIMVMATIDVQGVQNALGSGAASASIEVYNSGGTLLYEVGRVGSGATTVALATVDLFSQLFTIVNPGEQYKLVDTRGSGTGVITIANVFEFQFNAKYTAQNWTHLEQMAASKLNTYAAGVNRIPDKAEAFAYGASGTITAGSSEVCADRMTLWLYNYAVTFFNILTGTGGKRVFDLKDNGGTAKNIASLGAILGGAAEFGGGTLQGVVVSNALGTVHNVETGTGGTLTRRKIEFVAPAYADVVFSGGNSGIDSSGNGRNGTLIGSPRPAVITSPFAGFGDALRFDGVQNYVLAPASVSVSGAFCIEAKVVTTTSGVSRFIAGKWGNTNATRNIAILLSASNLPQGVVMNSTPAQITLSGPALTAGQHDIAFTYDGANVRLFADGALVAGPTAVSGLQAPDATTQFTIGCALTGAGLTPGNFYDSTAEEVRVSNIVRYTSAYTPLGTPFTTDANTIGLWHLDVIGPGESGVATGNKFRALDLRASKGANMGSATTHATITVGSPTTIASISTAWRIITVAASFSTNVLTNAILTIAVDGVPISALQNTSAGNMTFQSMALFILPAGSSATITASGTMTVDRIHAWTVA